MCCVSWRESHRLLLEHPVATYPAIAGTRISRASKRAVCRVTCAITFTSRDDRRGIADDRQVFRTTATGDVARSRRLGRSRARACVRVCVVCRARPEYSGKYYGSEGFTARARARSERTPNDEGGRGRSTPGRTTPLGRKPEISSSPSDRVDPTAGAERERDGR